MLLRKVQICEEICHLSKHHVKSLVKMMLFEDKTVEMLQDMAIKLLFNKSLDQIDWNDELLTQIQNHINEKKENSKHKKKKNKRKKHTIKTNSNEINTLLDLPTVLISSISQYLPNQETIHPLGLTNRELYQLVHQTRIANSQKTGNQNPNLYIIDDGKSSINWILSHNQTILKFNCNNIYRISKHKSDLSNYCQHYKTLIIDISAEYFDFTEFNEDTKKNDILDKLDDNTVVFKRNLNGTLSLMSRNNLYQINYNGIHSWHTADTYPFVIQLFKNNILDTKWFKQLLISIETLIIHQNGTEILSLFPLDILFGENSNLKHLEFYDSYCHDLGMFQQFDSNLEGIVKLGLQNGSAPASTSTSTSTPVTKNGDTGINCDRDNNNINNTRCIKTMSNDELETKQKKINTKKSDDGCINIHNNNCKIKLLETYTYENKSTKCDSIDDSIDFPLATIDLYQCFRTLRLVNELELDIDELCNDWSEESLEVLVSNMVKLFHTNLTTLELFKNIEIYGYLDAYDDEYGEDIMSDEMECFINSLYFQIIEHERYTQPKIETLTLHEANESFYSFVNDDANLWFHLMMNWFNTLETINLKFSNNCFSNASDIIGYYYDDEDEDNTRGNMLLNLMNNLLQRQRFKKLKTIYIMFSVFYGHRNPEGANDSGNNDGDDNTVTRLIDNLNTKIDLINENKFEHVEIGCKLIKWQRKEKKTFANDDNYNYNYVCVENCAVLKWDEYEQLSITKLSNFEKMLTKTTHDKHDKAKPMEESESMQATMLENFKKLEKRWQI